MKQVFLLVLLGICSCELLQVAFVFRHGARFPLQAIYDGKEQEPDWGELLPSGMRQHYNLGSQLRNEYVEELGFLRPDFNHTEFQIRSTDVNRTIQSALSQIMGMYPEGPKIPASIKKEQLLPPYKGVQNFIDEVSALPHGVQPIPVHIEPQDYDVLSTDCQGESQLTKQEKQRLQATIDSFNNVTQDVRERICGKFNQPIKSCQSASTLYSIWGVYISDLYQGRAVPHLEEDERLFLELGSSFQFYLGFADSVSTHLSKPFFDDVQKHFSSKIANPTHPLKWLSYSCHDDNIIQYLTVFNMSSPECLLEGAKQGQAKCFMQPPYAANFLFELHDIEGQNFVKVKYNGEVVRVCGGESDFCLYSDFQALLAKRLPSQEKWNAVCKSSQQSKKNYQLDALQRQIEAPVQMIQYNSIQSEESSSKFGLIYYVLLAQYGAIIALIYIISKKYKKNKQVSLDNADVGEGLIV